MADTLEQKTTNKDTVSVQNTGKESCTVDSQAKSSVQVTGDNNSIIQSHATVSESLQSTGELNIPHKSLDESIKNLQDGKNRYELSENAQDDKKGEKNENFAKHLEKSNNNSQEIKNPEISLKENPKDNKTAEKSKTIMSSIKRFFKF